MVSSYLLCKLMQRSRNKRIKAEKSVSQLNVINRYKGKCRICLEVGVIPIFGNETIEDISDSVSTFADIELNADDDLPALLCDACHKLLQAAIMFRTTAQQSDKLLKETYSKIGYYEKVSANSMETLEEIQDDKTKDFFLRKIKKKYHCKDCFENFKTLDEYYQHVSSPEHEKEKSIPNIDCQICNKTLKKKYFKHHLDLHKIEKFDKVKCRHCDQLFRKDAYKDHLKTHKTDYICEVCGRSFLRRNVYKCHLQIHTSEFPFQCQYCPYKGRNLGLLKIHQRTHTGDYRHECKECSAKFLTSSNLKRHMTKHTGRNIECDTCKRKFYSKTEMTQHYKVDHMGIKEHTCDICGKEFGYRNAMQKHQIHVHKREKYLGGKGRQPAYLSMENQFNK